MSQNDGTEWRQRIQSEAEHFVDVSSMSSDAIARMINEDKIQILVNLNGYTKVLLTDLRLYINYFIVCITHSILYPVTFIYQFIEQALLC